MGEPGRIVAAAVVAHQPTIMLDEGKRIALGGGRDTTLVEPGFRRLRQRLDDRGANTLVIVDTHWFTTFEHVIAGAEHFRGHYTSEEVPRVISDHPYDYPGAPELARSLHATAKGQGVRTTNATSPHLPLHYPTINLVHWLRHDEQVLSIGILQTAGAEEFLRFGQVLGEAIAATDGVRAAVLASGGMSHTFHDSDTIGDHLGYDPEHVHSAEARAFDHKVLELWAAGDHAAVIDAYPEYRAFSPEGRFGHYLITAGALGGRGWRAPGEPCSDYENSAGTGQVHVVFDLEAP
jgi:3,4-dihydroxyphenylacetate 2,3-dioxygenase